MRRIVGYEVFPVANPQTQAGGPVWMFLRLDADDGSRGWGEIFTSPAWMRPLVLAALVADLVEDYVVGREITSRERVRQDVRNSHYSRAGDGTKAAILSGIDVAMWDLVGQRSGESIANLLGGRIRERVPTYTYLDPPDGVDPEDFWADADATAARAQALRDEGFTAVKFDPFPLLTGGSSHVEQYVPLQPSSSLLERAAASVLAVRQALGSTCELIVGTHGQFTAAAAIRFARLIEPASPLWFEEPVPPGRAEDMARVARMTSIPIAAGERLSELSAFTELLEAGAVGVINPDVTLVGGITEAKRLASVAEAFGVQWSPHVYGGPLAAAASLHVAISTPNLLTMEGNGRFDGFHAELLTEPLRWEGGYLHLTDAPGLGTAIDEAVARRHRVSADLRFMSAMPSRES